MPDHRSALFEQPLAEFEAILPPADQGFRRYEHNYSYALARRNHHPEQLPGRDVALQFKREILSAAALHRPPSCRGDTAIGAGATPWAFSSTTTA